MAVNLSEPEKVYSIKGINLATAAAGIRYQDRHDLVLIEINENASVAGVFTKNKFCAAPVKLAKEYLSKTTPRFFIINAGNANAGTGKSGLDAAIETTQLVSQEMSVLPTQVIPFSTGVIGELINVDKIKTQLHTLHNSLSDDKWLEAAKAIMTTDTVSKAISEKVTVRNQTIHITGICKGSGMIQPNMATMLAYIATDLAIEKETLQSILSESVEHSFNAITVDSDTSTNDSCMLIATGAANLEFAELDKAEQHEYLAVLNRVMQKLAQSIIRDGEGVSKFVTIKIMQASDFNQAKLVAYSVANSPLVKTALSASDPNWGRIMAAVGKCEDDNLDLSKANLLINSVQVVSDGGLDKNYTEKAGKLAMSEAEIEIMIDLNLGDSHFTVWTTDLTHEYISINADYRS